MFSGRGQAVMYRPLYLSPRQGTLLGLIWIAVQKNREAGTGEQVEERFLRDLIFTAQNRGLIHPAAHFQFDRSSLPDLEAPGIRQALTALKEADILCVSKTGGAIYFPNSGFFDLPTGIFRYLYVFGCAALVDEFTGGRDDE